MVKRQQRKHELDRLRRGVGARGREGQISEYHVLSSLHIGHSSRGFSRVFASESASIEAFPVRSAFASLNRISSDTGVRERVSGALVQNSGVGESDGSDDVGGEKSALATVRGEVGGQSEEVLQVQNVRRKLHGDSGIVVGARGPRERNEGRGRGAGEVEDWVATATGR